MLGVHRDKRFKEPVPLGKSRAATDDRGAGLPVPQRFLLHARLDCKIPCNENDSDFRPVSAAAGRLAMSAKKNPPNIATTGDIIDSAKQVRKRRGNVYRERALKILPWVCAWCGREFNSRKLHELTVHHKDHNHHNNPADGSNWELLCLYCHDSEHSRSLDQDIYGEVKPGEDQKEPGTYKAFADLKSLLKNKK